MANRSSGRETVRAALDVLHDPGLVDPLRAALSDPDPCVRRLAAPLLGRVRIPQAVAALRNALRDQGAETREAAALGLGFAGDNKALPDLITTLRDAAPDVRVAAAWALGQIESRGGVRPLERFAIDSSSQAANEFQGHRERTLFGHWEDAKVTLAAGTVVVPMNQPLARLVFTLLEPRSDDGIVNWNVVDDAVVKRSYPILRSF